VLPAPWINISFIFFTLSLALPLKGEGRLVIQEGLRPSWTPRFLIGKSLILIGAAPLLLSRYSKSNYFY
jgi:hypothetical protein